MEIISALKQLDYSPLFISIKTGIAATVISFFLALFLAVKLPKFPKRIERFVDTLITLPMVLPPTVAGFILLIVFSRRRTVGIFLYDKFDIKVVQSFLGCVLAAVVIAFPLMYKNIRAAFMQVDENLIHAGRTLGLSDRVIFWRILVPNAMPGIAAGTVLAFARAMGEYGATSMLAGNIPGKTGTVSQKIAMVVQDGDYMTAGLWTIIVILIAFAIIYSVNVLSDSHKRKS